MVIEVAGMPKAMKTSLIESAAPRLGFMISAEDEMRRLIEESLDKRGENFFIEDGGYYLIWELLKHGRLAEKFLKLCENQPSDQPIINDRGELDALVFLRSGFLFGRIPGNRFPTVHEFFKLPLHFNQAGLAYRNALVFCLVHPELSLLREGPRDEPGRIMNLPFLKVLYEQYLRFYQELLNSHPSFPFVCLNTSGGFEDNQKLFNNTINQILSFLTHQANGNV